MKLYKYLGIILLIATSCILWPYVIADFIKYFFILSNKYFATPLFTWKQYLALGFIGTGAKILMANLLHEYAHHCGYSHGNNYKTQEKCLYSVPYYLSENVKKWL